MLMLYWEKKITDSTQVEYTNFQNLTNLLKPIQAYGVHGPPVKSY